MTAFELFWRELNKLLSEAGKPECYYGVAQSYFSHGFDAIAAAKDIIGQS